MIIRLVGRELSEGVLYEWLLLLRLLSPLRALPRQTFGISKTNACCAGTTATPI